MLSVDQSDKMPMDSRLLMKVITENGKRVSVESQQSDMIRDSVDSALTLRESAHRLSNLVSCCTNGPKYCNAERAGVFFEMGSTELNRALTPIHTERMITTKSLLDND